jgi:NAD(P)-dependent dehydrogenase (short-subunit alcohol dehydrogenase family)
MTAGIRKETLLGLACQSTVMVTGASAGLGEAIIRRYTQLGDRVLLHSPVVVLPRPMGHHRASDVRLSKVNDTSRSVAGPMYGVVYCTAVQISSSEGDLLRLERLIQTSLPAEVTSPQSWRPGGRG